MSKIEEDALYDAWNTVKKKSNKKSIKVGFKEREIFWVRVGQNIGAEEFGKGNEFQRPVLIVRKLTSRIFFGVPLTSTIKDNDYFHSFSYTNKKGTKTNSAMLLQLKTFDKKRLMGRIGMIDKDNFMRIKQKISNLFIPQENLVGLPEGELQHHYSTKPLKKQEVESFKSEEL